MSRWWMSAGSSSSHPTNRSALKPRPRNDATRAVPVPGGSARNRRDAFGDLPSPTVPRPVVARTATARLGSGSEDRVLPTRRTGAGFADVAPVEQRVPDHQRVRRVVRLGFRARRPARSTSGALDETGRSWTADALLQARARAGRAQSVAFAPTARAVRTRELG